MSLADETCLDILVMTGVLSLDDARKIKEGQDELLCEVLMDRGIVKGVEEAQLRSIMDRLKSRSRPKRMQAHTELLELVSLHFMEKVKQSSEQVSKDAKTITGSGFHALVDLALKKPV